MARSSRPGPRIAVAATLLVAVAACGGGPAAAPAAAPAPQPPAPQAQPAPQTQPAPQAQPASEFCRARVQIDSVLARSSPAAGGAADPAQQLSTLEPLFASVRESAPEDVAGDVDVLVEAATQGLSGGGDLSAVATPAYTAAEEAVDAKALAECGFTETAVTAADYEYLGVPDSLTAGPGALTLTNEGSQVHEIMIVRIEDDVALSPEEVLALPTEEAMASVQLVGTVSASPGETDTTFIDAGPGRYVAACTVPEGTVSPEAAGFGPPHFTLGMLTEFTVA